jgi:hypothetical protein
MAASFVPSELEATFDQLTEGKAEKGVAIVTGELSKEIG